MFLQKNLNALAKRYPHYAEAILNADIGGKYSVVQSGDNTANIFDNELKTYFYNNISPKTAAQQDILSRNIKVPEVAVFLGCGFMYSIIAYKNAYPQSIVVIIENDLSLLKLSFTYFDLSQLINSPNTFFCIDNIYIDLTNVFFDTAAKTYLKAINIIECAPSFKSYKNFYIKALNDLKTAVSTTLNRFGNCPEDSLIGIRNTFININTILENPGIKDLKNVFKGKPGIVVSAGPSLNKNIHLLEQLYDKAVICGAETTLTVLQKRGLKPHMVTSLERTGLVYKLFEGQTEESLKDIYLSACPVVPKAVYDNYPGEKIIVYRNFATFKWLDIDKGIVDIGPSSGNMAFDVLDYLGCDPIIIIGQDLAYGDGDITHAENTVLGNVQKVNAKDLYVEGNYQPKVKTTEIWNMFRNFYEVSVAKSKSLVINATEGGAKINGTKLMTFQEAIDKYISKSFDPLSIIKRKLSKPNSAMIDRERKKVIKKVKLAIEYCRNLVKIFIDLVEEYNNFYNDVLVHYANDPSLKPQVDEFRKKIEEGSSHFASKDFYLLLMHYVQSYVISSMNQINEIRAMSDESAAADTALMAKYAEMYLYIARLTEIMSKELTDMLDILENNK